MIKYITGNLFDTKANIICHQVNCKGIMGAGVAKQIKERYPSVYMEYRNLCCLLSTRSDLLLGQILVCPHSAVSKNTKKIVNCFAQDGFAYHSNATDYAALDKCFDEIEKKFPNETIAMPFKIGCGLAGGDWEIVKALIEKHWNNSKNTLELWELKQ